MSSITLIPGKEKRVYSGHPWVFRSDIQSVSGEPLPGSIVDVLSSRGRFLAKAFYNPASQIALRIMSLRDEPIDEAFIRRRIHEAVEYRRTFADLHSCRMVFAESDRLPALIVDSFGDVLVLQCLALGMEPFKETVVDALVEELHPAGIYERNDVPVRTLEGLPLTTGLLYGKVPDRVEMTENGIRFLVDVKEGQKTGFFLDQKENRAAIAPFVKGRTVLDCFTHTGSFALNAAAAGASSVLAVDASDLGIAQAEENARLNNLENIVSFKCADVFDLLPQLEAEKELFDVVILDPPAFTKSRASIKKAVTGYREINIRGMRLVKNGGFLATCSCSHFMDEQLFIKTIGEAARDAHKRLRQVEFRQQAADHPILWANDTSYYLKFLIFQVVDEI